MSLDNALDGEHESFRRAPCYIRRVMPWASRSRALCSRLVSPRSLMSLQRAQLSGASARTLCPRSPRCSGRLGEPQAEAGLGASGPAESAERAGDRWSLGALSRSPSRRRLRSRPARPPRRRVSARASPTKVQAVLLVERASPVSRTSHGNERLFWSRSHASQWSAEGNPNSLAIGSYRDRPPPLAHVRRKGRFRRRAELDLIVSFECRSGIEPPKWP